MPPGVRIEARVSDQRRTYIFRPPDLLAEQLEEYRRVELRRSANEAMIVLMTDALERWRLSKLPRAERASDYPQ
jgi:hypothetical protein